MSAGLTEDTVEQAALEWLSEIGFDVVSGYDIAPGEPEAERESFGDVVLAERLRDAIRRLNARSCTVDGCGHPSSQVMDLLVG